MASGSSLVKFDRTRNTSFFLCRKCKTHIHFPEEDEISIHAATRSINVDTAVNLVKRTPEHLLEGPDAKMAYMVCVECKTPLGWKYVEVLSPTDLIREGRCILFLDRLLFWSGVRTREGTTILPRTESSSGTK